MTVWTILYLVVFICVAPFIFAAMILSIYVFTDEIDTPEEEDEWNSLDW